MGAGLGVGAASGDWPARPFREGFFFMGRGDLVGGVCARVNAEAAERCAGPWDSPRGEERFAWRLRKQETRKPGKRHITTAGVKAAAGNGVKRRQGGGALGARERTNTNSPL